MNDVITLKFVTMCGIDNGNGKSQHSFVKFDGKKNLGAAAWPCYIQKLCYNEVFCKKMALYLIISCQNITEILWKVTNQQ